MGLSIQQWLATENIDHRALCAPGETVTGVAYWLAQSLWAAEAQVFALAPLAEVWQLPLAVAEDWLCPFAHLTFAVAQVLDCPPSQCDVAPQGDRQHDLTLNRSGAVWLVAQSAYLLALAALLEQETRLRHAWLYRAKLPRHRPRQTLDPDPDFAAVVQEFLSRPINDMQAEMVISAPVQSTWLRQLHDGTQLWLQAQGASELEAQLLRKRLERSLPGYFWQQIIQAGSQLKLLQAALPVSHLAAQHPMMQAAAQHRAQLLQRQGEPLFDELFAPADLYEAPDGQLATGDWVELPLWLQQDRDITEHISVIVGGAGSGKTTLLEQYAAMLARQVGPLPLVIPVATHPFTGNLSQWLQNYVPLPYWEQMACVFLLDGLEQLQTPGSPPTWNTLNQFGHAIAAFLAASPWPHKIILTTRDRAVEQWQWPLPLRVCELLPMGRDRWQQWFKRWARLTSAATSQALFSLLKTAGVFVRTHPPNPFSVWIRQPLGLYWLGRYHRAGQLDTAFFEQDVTQAQAQLHRTILAQFAAVELPVPAALESVQWVEASGVLWQTPPDWAAIRERLQSRLWTPLMRSHLQAILSPTQQLDLLRHLQQLEQDYWQQDWSAPSPQADGMVGLNLLLLQQALPTDTAVRSGARSQRALTTATTFAQAPPRDRFARLIQRINQRAPESFRVHAGPFLAGLSLPYAQLRGACLWRVNLDKSVLVGVDFTGANLMQASLFQAQLSDACLVNVHLGGANLRQANLQGANLRGANLLEADLRQVQWSGAQLAGAYLSPEDQRLAVQQGAIWTESASTSSSPNVGGRSRDREETTADPATDWLSDVANVAAQPDADTVVLAVHPLPDTDEMSPAVQQLPSHFTAGADATLVDAFRPLPDFAREDETLTAEPLEIATDDQTWVDRAEELPDFLGDDETLATEAPIAKPLEAE